MSFIRSYKKKLISSASVFLSCIMLININATLFGIYANADGEQHLQEDSNDKNDTSMSDVDAKKSGVCGDGISWQLNDSGLLTVTGSGKLDSNIISNKNVPWNDFKNDIKEIMIGNGVKNIGGFSECVNLEKITLGNSIETIENDAFSGCTSIKNVIIPQSVSSIGSKAFFNCQALDTLSLQEGISFVGAYAFAGCSSLKEVSLPKTITLIGDRAFGYVSGSIDTSFKISGYLSSAAENYADAYGLHFTALDKETIPSGNINDSIVWEISDDTLKITGSGAMNDFSSSSNTPWAKYLSGGYFSMVSVGDGITAIGTHSFSGLNGVEGISIASSVKRIGKNAFSESTIRSITIPSGTEMIDTAAFKNCKGLVSVFFGSDLKTIGESAFEGCTSLETITIPYCITTIGIRAFYGCTALSSVSLSDSVKLISSEAFSGCSKLKNINFPIFLETIGTKAFYECKSLSSISISGSVKDILSEAFFGCTSLKTVTLASGTITIGDYAFSGCSALSSISIPDSVSSLGEGAFYNCSGMTHATIGAGVRTIYTKTFENCSSLKEIVLSEGLEALKDGAFTNCTSLKEATIPQSVYSMDLHSIGYSCVSINGSNSYIQYADFIIKGYHPSAAETYAAAYGFTFASTGSVGEANGTFGNGLSWDIKITSGTLKISGTGEMPEFGSAEEVPWAFYSSAIQNIIIERGITSIGAYSFAGSSNVSSISFPTTLRSIGAYAFADCTLIETVELPSSLISIGEYAFANCSKIESVRISENLKSVGTHAFYNCEALTSVTISESIEQIGDKAFGYISEDAKSSLTIYGYKDSAAETYALKNAINFVISGSLVMSDALTDVQISFSESENTLNYEFKIYRIKPEDHIHYVMVDPDCKIEIYSTSIIRLGEVISPRNSFELSVPIPQDADPLNCKIYHINGNGTFTKLESQEEDGRLVFESPDMLDFIITDADLSSIYTAKIDYLYDNGAAAAPSLLIYCSPGAEFDVGSPEIPGFSPSEFDQHVLISNKNITYIIKYSKGVSPNGSKTDIPSQDDEETTRDSKYILLLIIEITVLVMTAAAAGIIIWIYIKKRKNISPESDSMQDGAQTIVLESTSSEHLKSSDSTALYGAIGNLEAGHDISYEDDLELDDSQFEQLDTTSHSSSEEIDSKTEEDSESKEDLRISDEPSEDEDVKIYKEASEDDDVKIYGKSSEDDDVKIYKGSSEDNDISLFKAEGAEAQTKKSNEDTIVIDIIGKDRTDKDL